MSNIVMLGASQVRKRIADHLASALPPLIDAARVQWELEDYELPYPVKYDSYDPLTANVFPNIGSLVNRTSGWSARDINDHAEQVYEATYAVQVFVWVRTPELPDGTWMSPEYDSALALRDNMLALMRSVILTTPSLGSSGVLRVEEGSLNEDYLGAIKSSDQSARWLAGGVFNMNMTVSEANYVPRKGTAQEVIVTGHHINEEGVAQ